MCIGQIREEHDWVGGFEHYETALDRPDARAEPWSVAHRRFQLRMCDQRGISLALAHNLVEDPSTDIVEAVMVANVLLSILDGPAQRLFPLPLAWQL